MSEEIIITDAAAAKVKELIKDDNVLLGLRIVISGGGCSGFNYGFEFATDNYDDDNTFEKNGIKFIIDPISFNYMKGSTIDYIKEKFNEQFVINNPNIISNCGCGSSFSV